MPRTNHTDIYSSFSIFYKSLRCLGIVPLSFDSEKRQFTLRRKCRLLGIVIVLCIISLQVFLYSFCEKIYPYLLSHVLIGTDWTVVFALLLIYFNLSSTKIVNLLSEIDTYDRNVNFSYSSERLLRKYFFLSCTHIIIFMSTDLIYRRYSSGNGSSICLISSYLSSSFNLLTRLLFVFFIKEIQIRFEYLGKVTNSKLLLPKLIQLGEICRKLNDFYNFPLLRNFGKLFIWLTMDIVHVVLYEEGSTEKFFVVIMSCSWWVLNFCEVMLIVQPVEALYSKVSIWWFNVDKK